jgi:hypothetical protein
MILVCDCVDEEQTKPSGPALVSESGPAVRVRYGQSAVVNNMDTGS